MPNSNVKGDREASLFVVESHDPGSLRVLMNDIRSVELRDSQVHEVEVVLCDFVSHVGSSVFKIGAGKNICGGVFDVAFGAVKLLCGVRGVRSNELARASYFLRSNRVH